MRNKNEESREGFGEKREGLYVEFIIFPFVSFLFFTQVTPSLRHWLSLKKACSVTGVMVRIHVHYQVNLNL